MAAPVADFTFTPQSGNPPLTVQCTDKSTGSPTSWFWIFDDGNRAHSHSTEQNPSHVFTAPPYLWRFIELTVMNCDGSNTKKIGPFPGGVYLQTPA